MGYILSLCSPNPSWVFAAKKLIFYFHLTIEASAIWSSSRVLTTEYAGDCFWMSEENFSWNPPEQHVVIVGADNFFLSFSDPKTQPFSAILQLWSLKSL